MDARAELLTAFYPTMDRTQAKLETERGGLAYLESLASLARVRYGEWIDGMFKYRLAGIGEAAFETLLSQHLASEVNFCMYFHPERNAMFCFNLDRFQKTEDSLRALARILLSNLRRLCIEPLVLKSGHGFHFWCRLGAPVENGKLQAFMQDLTDVSVFQAVTEGVNIDRLQFICYPRVRADDISIRMFGCHHTVSRRFSHVVASLEEECTLLGEEESWAAFAAYMEKYTVAPAAFGRALGYARRLRAAIR